MGIRVAWVLGAILLAMCGWLIGASRAATGSRGSEGVVEAPPPTVPAPDARKGSAHRSRSAPAADLRATFDAPAAPAAPADARVAIGRAIERALPSLRTPRDLDGYLAGLETRARRAGRVTALDVEPGLAAIHSGVVPLDRDDALARELAFTRAMATLSATLDHRATDDDARPLP